MITEIKTYRAVCDRCDRKSRRFEADDEFDVPLPKGWRENEGGCDPKGYGYESDELLCPKCAKKEKTS